MKLDKRLLTAAILLPVTIFLLGAALFTGLPAGAAGNIPIVPELQAETCVNIPIEVTLEGTDADSDIVLYQLTEEPKLGTARIEATTLYYTPGAKAGKDHFGYTAVDAEGNTAKTGIITIVVNKNRANLTYADMDGNPAHYAALCLSEQGIMTGERIGDCYFFRPTQTVTRSEFITMAAALADLPIEPTEQTDFADDEGLSSWAKPYISTAAASGLVSGYPTNAGLSEIRGQNPITLAEASVVIGNLLGQSMNGLQYTLSAPSNDMDWAQQAISTLDRLDVISPLTALRSESEPITRQDACEMLYRSMQLLDA